ncbi:hypothetical protein AN214_03152 [Pseudoalteromonas sp. P1-9]|uniref:hypothetical protein n=1 Tax=Pseudoalteromonas sp. P1-9 TaxID=1710354 RepID=UPI0006D5EE4C|nr:hypothetical protein [Pseudoalteromonas sp. P1-9]KPV94746.1 hypothetical protein AN214_03152 [Pseudoalteromonas sp. P1-9]
MKKLNDFNPCYIPKLNSQAYQLLLLLLDNDEVAETELTRIFNGRQRSPLQILGGDKYCWNIINHTNDKGVIFARSLDPRHKSGSKPDDAKARAERKSEYKQDSHKLAKQGRIRESKAFIESIRAKSELADLVSNAANDDHYNQQAQNEKANTAPTVKASNSNTGGKSLETRHQPKKESKE